MKDMNRVFLMGRLGTAPVLSRGKNGKPYARLNLATKRFRTGENGEATEESDWHTVWVWGRQGEVCVEHLRKGATVFVEGYLSYWQAEGEKLTKTGIQASSVHFISPRAALNLDKGDGAREDNAVAHPA
jgi:single-strand DNA-binding protein